MNGMNRYIEAEFRDRLSAAKERAEKAEAAIQRVRELAEFWKAQVADSPSGASWIYMSAASRLLLDALEGDVDE